MATKDIRSPGIKTLTTGGVTGIHFDPGGPSLVIAPANKGEFNVVKFTFAPIACLRIEDLRFNFDSSIPLPELAAEMKSLAELRQLNPRAPISIFGHADPVGSDHYNKILSGRRAKAIYALLTNQIKLWEDLDSHPLGGDKWGVTAFQFMLDALLFDPGPPTGETNPTTEAAIEKFQSENGLGISGHPDKPTRTKLYQQYHDFLVRFDLQLPPLAFDPENDFIAHKADAGLKGDVQGCGEFNPVLLLSRDESVELQNPDKKKERAAANAPNRRVLVYFFPEGTRIDPNKWPCPRITEGTADCRKRFFSDSDDRLALADIRREYADTKDTFACRFYDRIAHDSPCEIEQRTEGFIDLQTVDDFGVRVGNAALTLHLPDGTTREIQTDAKGYHRERNIPDGELTATLPDGTSAKFILEGKETDAIIHTKLASSTITHLLVKRNLSDKDRKEREQLEQIHSRSFENKNTVTARSATTNPTSQEPTENPTAQPVVRSLFHCIDNLALVAGLDRLTGAFDTDKFLSVLDLWLSDFHPTAHGRGYFVHLLTNSTIRTFTGDRQLKGSFLVDHKSPPPFGAFAVFESDTDAAFLDMSNRVFTAPAPEGVTPDASGLVPIAAIVVASQRDEFIKLEQSLAPRLEILYRLPEPAELVAVGREGGTGVLENYPPDKEVNDHAHQRNLAVVRWCNTVYNDGILENYISAVKAAKDEDDIRQLGPPKNPYVFATPAGATDPQISDIASANNASSLHAWIAIAEKLDKLAGQHAEGALFFRVKCKLKFFEQKSAFTNLIPWIRDIAIEDNIDVGTDGLLTKGPVLQGSIAEGLTEGTAKKVRMGNVQAGVKQEVNVFTGKQKTTYSLDLGVAKIEAADDGTRKITTAAGESAEFNTNSGEFGTGVKFSADKVPFLNKVISTAALKKSEVYIGIHFQGVREDTLYSFFSAAPGFFERRSVKELLATTTQWNDLRADEHTRLSELGWDQSKWDKKHLLTIDEFPTSARTSFADLNSREKMALVGLGIRQFEQPSVWKKAAKQ